MSVDCAPRIPLRENSQLDVNLEVNVPVPHWRVFSIAAEEDTDHDPVESAQEVAQATLRKAQERENKIKRFQVLTAHRSRVSKSKLNTPKVMIATPRQVAPRTGYQDALANVSVCWLNSACIDNSIIIV
jgi:hypothetical protein